VDQNSTQIYGKVTFDREYSISFRTGGTSRVFQCSYQGYQINFFGCLQDFPCKIVNRKSSCEYTTHFFCNFQPSSARTLMNSVLILIFKCNIRGYTHICANICRGQDLRVNLQSINDHSCAYRFSFTWA
jgi:hypothetical protein